MRFRCVILVVVLFFFAVGRVDAGSVNTGLLISQANQDADLTLGNVPRNMTDASDLSLIHI